jgi:hypothetical protein
MFMIHRRVWVLSVLLLFGLPQEGALASPPWGDGSAGDLTVAVSGILGVTVATDSNFQFRDFTVEPGVTLQVASGTVIRCSRKFLNQGNIVVLQGEHGGTAHGGGRAPAGQGVAHRAPGYGAVGDLNGNTLGGESSRGLSEAEARSLRHVGPSAGGAGGSSGIFGAGGLGGGSFTVLARRGITNFGMIHADPAFPVGLISPGDGGGAGGVILLASRHFVTNLGLITARGANGEDGGAAVGYVAGGGGGGGGGIVHFLSPEIDAGKVNVDGGFGGAASGPSPFFQHSGGGAGGACGGDGGAGGGVPPGTGGSHAGHPGDAGYLLETKVDPALLF